MENIFFGTEVFKKFLAFFSLWGDNLPMNCQCHFLQLTYMTKCDDVNLMFLTTFSTWNKWQNLFPTDHNYSDETGNQNLGFEFFFPFLINS